MNDKSPINLGWRVVNILNKHTIPNYSYEPPTTEISGGFSFAMKKGGFGMKNKIILVATVLGMSNISPGICEDYCRECRSYKSDGVNIVYDCIEYGDECCEPCKFPTTIKPIECTEQLCSGETVWDGDTCTQTDIKGCVNNECVTTGNIYCKAGYYGNSPQLNKLTKACTGCEKCPPSNNGPATTSTPGNNDTITKCFILSGSTFHDSTGSGRYTADCYYKL